MKYMKSLIICVNYNSYNDLLKYLDSLFEADLCYQEEHSLMVLIADNSNEKQQISKNYSFGLLHSFTGENLGYFGAVTYAIREAQISLSSFDYVIISNVDLIVAWDFFIKLYASNFEEDVGCIAPYIYSINECIDRNPKILVRTSLKKLKVLKLMYKVPALYYLYTSLLYPIRRTRLQNCKECYIYAPHGSFMIFTKRFANFIQSMQYPIFLFGEEIFIAENLRNNSLKTIYKPEIKVYDSDHVSTRKLKSKVYLNYNYQAVDMLIKDYFCE